MRTVPPDLIRRGVDGGEELDGRSRGSRENGGTGDAFDVDATTTTPTIYFRHRVYMRGVRTCVWGSSRTRTRRVTLLLLLYMYKTEPTDF